MYSLRILKVHMVDSLDRTNRQATVVTWPLTISGQFRVDKRFDELLKQVIISFWFNSN